MSFAQPIQFQDFREPSPHPIAPLREIVNGLSEAARTTLRPFGRTTLDWLLEPRDCPGCHDRPLVGTALHAWSQHHLDDAQTLGLTCPTCSTNLGQWTLAEIAQRTRLP